MLKIIHRQKPPSGNLWIDPVKDGVITSAWGNRTSPINGSAENHKGIDIGVPVNTEVMAVKSGTVTKEGYSPSYGNYIGYKTYDGYDVFYAHLNKTNAKKGDVVEQGQIVAYSGNTGSSTGPHLHYELEYNNKMINPSDYLSLH